MQPIMSDNTDRRAFLRCGSFWLAAAALAGGGRAAFAVQPKPPHKEEHNKEEHKEEHDHDEEEDISATEDLMREHGLVLRVLVVYDEGIRRLAAGESPGEPIAEAARLIRSFVEDYHEKLEEEYLFPRFRKADRLTELVETLKKQHDAGRRVTDTVLRLSTAEALKEDAHRRELSAALQGFGRMYIPHMGREDTVLFPALRSVVSEQEFERLGDVFENREQELFGEHGFERQVERMAEIEKSAGVNDLAKFTVQ
jgi:hemerythrin-like domain-containing protein